MSNNRYSHKLIAKYLLQILIVAAAMKFTGGAGFAIIVPFAFYALLQNKPDSLMFYMCVIGAMVVCNSKVIPKNALFFMEQRAIIMLFGFFMAVKVGGMRKSPVVAPFMLIIPYVLYMAIPSFFGWCPIISYLKLFLFSVVFLAYWGIANVVAINPRQNLVKIRSVLLAIAIFFLVGSIALLPFPGLSQMSEEEFLRNPDLNSLFMGLANHSQCLGPMVAGLSTILFADLLFGVRKLDKLYLFLLACCPLLIWKTSSRTAMGTYLGGFMFAAYFFTKSRWIGSRWKGKVMGFLWMGAFCLLAAMLASSSMRIRMARFVQKRGDEGARVEISMASVTSSRMGLVNQAMANFREKPLIGNGFQVSDAMADLKNVSFREMLTAPIEKGVWVSAILEEGGIIGFVIFVSFLLFVLFKMVKYKAYIAASTFFVFILSNMGEFSFFSMSYLGGFMWMLVFAAVMLDSARTKAEAYETQRRMMMR